MSSRGYTSGGELYEPGAFRSCPSLSSAAMRVLVSGERVAVRHCAISEEAMTENRKDLMLQPQSIAADKSVPSRSSREKRDFNAPCHGALGHAAPNQPSTATRMDGLLTQGNP